LLESCTCRRQEGKNLRPRRTNNLAAHCRQDQRPCWLTAWSNEPTKNWQAAKQGRKRRATAFASQGSLPLVVLSQQHKQPAAASSTKRQDKQQPGLAAPEPAAQTSSSTSSSHSSQSNSTSTQYSTSKKKSKGHRERKQELICLGVDDGCVDGLLGWMDGGARAGRSRPSQRPALLLPRTTATALSTMAPALVASSVPPALDREPREVVAEAVLSGRRVAPERRPTGEAASYTAHPPRRRIGVAPGTVPPTSTNAECSQRPLHRKRDHPVGGAGALSTQHAASFYPTAAALCCEDHHFTQRAKRVNGTSSTPSTLQRGVKRKPGPQ